ncbi:MAG: PAS domain-containing protein [Methylocystis sp.]|uniref:PAS domain-containing protein n=1 Tax=Methylocystis sp. TaxID=1911079 RepID=UPI0039450612
MRLPVTRDLHDYWGRLKGKRAAPDRADIDPLAIRQILADTFIIEVDASRRFPIRLCGARINALWLAEQKGLHFLNWWSSRHCHDIAAALRQVVDNETPLLAHATAPEGGESTEFDLLLLPLRCFGARRSRVLGSLAPVLVPAWLGLRPIGQLDLVAARTLPEKVVEAPVDDWSLGPTRRMATAGGDSRSFP